MNLEDEIRAVLFELGKDIKIHLIDHENMIIEIDYDKPVAKIMQLLESSTYDQQ
jgi:hemerythrin